MKPLTKTMEAHLKYGIAGMTAATERALLARGLVEDSARKPGYLVLSVAGEKESARLLGEPIVSWKAGVLTQGDEDWVYNGLRFATSEEAEGYIRALAWKWMGVKATHVEPSKDPVTDRWVDGKAVRLEGGAA